MKNYNPNVLADKLSEVDWTNLYKEKNPDCAWELILETYYTHVNEIAPITEVTNVKEAESWTDAHLLDLIRSRDKLRQDIKLKPDPEESLIKEFRKKGIRLKRTVINAKRNFTRLKILNSEDNPKKYWGELNKVLPTGNKKDKSHEHEKIVLNNDNVEELNQDKTADFINDFFINIGPSLSAKIKTDNEDYLAGLEQASNCVSELRHPNSLEIEKLVNAIDISKSSK